MLSNFFAIICCDFTRIDDPCVLDSADIAPLTVDGTVDPASEQSQQEAPSGLESQLSETVRNFAPTDQCVNISPVMFCLSSCRSYVVIDACLSARCISRKTVCCARTAFSQLNFFSQDGATGCAVTSLIEESSGSMQLNVLLD